MLRGWSRALMGHVEEAELFARIGWRGRPNRGRMGECQRFEGELDQRELVLFQVEEVEIGGFGYAAETPTEVRQREGRSSGGLGLGINNLPILYLGEKQFRQNSHWRLEWRGDGDGGQGMPRGSRVDPRPIACDFSVFSKIEDHYEVHNDTDILINGDEIQL